MKHALSSLLVATALVAPAAFAQTTATTKPVGYETVQLAANQFNVIGLRLQGPAVASGALNSTNATNVTDTEADFSSLTSGKSYILEITSGNMAGLTVECTKGANNQTLNTVDDLDVAGVEDSASYTLRPALTLEDVFGTTSSVLKKGLNSSNADVVWVPNGQGGYVKYFLYSIDSTWKTEAGNPAPNVPIVYTDGVFVEKRGTSATLTVSGEVKVGSTRVPIIVGFNVVSTIYPAGVTLQNFGLEDDVKKGLNSSVADVIWVPNGSGNYDKYFLLSTDNTWRTWEGNPAPASVTLSPGVFIERKGAAKMFTVTPPGSYSNL